MEFYKNIFVFLSVYLTGGGSHSGDILFYRGKQYLLNDVQILEENNGYTMFKIMAIQQ